MSHKDKTIFSNNQMSVGHFFLRLSSQMFHKVKTKFSFCQIYYETFWGCPSFLTETINISNSFKSTTIILKSQIFFQKKFKLSYIQLLFVFIDMQVRINDNTFRVKTLIDRKSKAIGMMGKEFDSTFDGLLFLMGGDKQSFWMKNCIIPLDIIIIRNNVIVNIHHDCPPCRGDECPSYGGNGNIVLEVAGGTCEDLDIEPGDTVEYLF